MLLIIAIGGSYDRTTLQKYDDIMAQTVWPSQYVTIVGVTVASFSAALGSVFGGSRVLQALACDDLPPNIGMKIFKKGSKTKNEPRRAVLFTWFIAQLTCLFSNLEVISSIISSFFLLSYGSVNLTCLLFDLSRRPNFRPYFEFYSRTHASIGGLLCFIALFVLNVWYGVISFAFLILLISYISYTGSPKDWGDVSQSIMFHQARKYLMRLDDTDHKKNWRPNLLLLLDPGTINMRFIHFCNILKKGGLYAIGDCVRGDLNSVGNQIEDIRKNWVYLLRKYNIKAIPQVTFSPNLRLAFQQLIILAGLGGMRPNCVALIFPVSFHPLTADFSEQQKSAQNRLELLKNESLTNLNNLSVRTTPSPSYESISEFCDCLRDIVFSFQKHLLLACNFHPQFDNQKIMKTIDIWIIDSLLIIDGTLSLLFQLAHILRLEQKNTLLRIFNIVNNSNDYINQSFRLEKLIKDARIFGATSHIIVSRQMLPIEKIITKNKIDLAVELSSIIFSNSLSNTKVSLLALPSLCLKDTKDDDFVNIIKTITTNLPPTLLIMSAANENLISHEF